MKASVRFLSYRFRLSSGTVKSIKSFFNWLPVVFILGLFAWSYYIYVLKWIGLKIVHEDLFNAAEFFLKYHFLGGMALWSFYTCSFSKPPNLSLELENCERPADYSSGDDFFPVPGKKRYCHVCKIIKPERTCHCSWCNQCVPKMDHHCPWVGNCIGQHNYKAFILMLFYVILFGLDVLTSIYVYDSNHIAQYLYSIVVIGLSVALGCSVLLSFHIFLLLTNTTTLECGIRMAECNICSFKGYICFPDNVYNKGAKKNFKSVFGNKKKFWFLPIQPAETPADLQKKQEKKAKKLIKYKTRNALALQDQNPNVQNDLP